MADDASDTEQLKAADAKGLHRTVREVGEDELDRPTSSLVWSGLAAGIAINASLIAEGAIHSMTEPSTARTLIVSLGYPIGFVLVVLGRLQFFTESTITAMLPLVTRMSAKALGRTLRLWGIVLAANLVGTLLAAGVTFHLPLVDEAVRSGMVEVSAKLLTHDWTATFWSAVPAGFMIASIAWMLPNARSQSFLLIFAVTYVVGMAGFSHAIVGSDEAFLLAYAGRTTWAHAITGSILPAVLGNLAGGAGLFAILAHGQVRGEMPGEVSDDEGDR